MTSLAPSEDQLIRLRTPRDVLATVPRLLGYQPRRSIVFLNVHDGNAVSTMRVDLPDAAAGPLVEKRFVTSLVGMLCKVPDIRTTIVVVYADGTFEEAADVPRASLVRPLIRRLVDSGFEVHDALCVAADAWGAYDGHDAGVAHRLDELDEPAPGSETCAPVASDLDALAELPAVGEFARRAFEAALDRRLRTMPVATPVAAAEAAIAGPAGCSDTERLAEIMAVLLESEPRDTVLFTWAWGPGRGLALLDEIDRIEAGEVGPGDDTIALDLLGLGCAEAPDRERIPLAIAVMTKLAALAPEDVAHIPLTVLAWLHWSQGRGSVAARFLDRAREIDPHYGLAELLQTALGRGLLPNWLYAAPTR